MEKQLFRHDIDSYPSFWKYNVSQPRRHIQEQYNITKTDRIDSIVSI